VVSFLLEADAFLFAAASRLTRFMQGVSGVISPGAKRPSYEAGHSHPS